MRVTNTSNLMESRDANIVKADEIVVKWQRTWTVPNPRHLIYRAVGIVYFRDEIRPGLTVLLSTEPSTPSLSLRYPCPKTHDKVGTAPLRLVGSDLSDIVRSAWAWNFSPTFEGGFWYRPATSHRPRKTPIRLMRSVFE